MDIMLASRLFFREHVRTLLNNARNDASGSVKKNLLRIPLFGIVGISGGGDSSFGNSIITKTADSCRNKRITRDRLD